MGLKELRFVIAGKPVPQARHRSASWGGQYDPSASERKRVSWEIGEMVGRMEPIKDRPVSCRVRFIMPVPKSSPKWFKKLVAEGAPQPHYKKPDVDNLEKFLLDSMQGIVYHSDAQVFKMDSVKLYGVQPRTEVTLIYEED